MISVLDPDTTSERGLQSVESEAEEKEVSHDGLTRRTFVQAAGSLLTIASLELPGIAQAQRRHDLPAHTSALSLNINGQLHQVTIDTRTSLLDALREHLDLTGSKKGCDHGQCGACTVLLNGRRVNSCLTLAVAA